MYYIIYSSHKIQTNFLQNMCILLYDCTLLSFFMCPFGNVWKKAINHNHVLDGQFELPTYIAIYFHRYTIADPFPTPDTLFPERCMCCILNDSSIVLVFQCTDRQNSPVTSPGSSPLAQRRKPQQDPLQIPHLSLPPVPPRLDLIQKGIVRSPCGSPTGSPKVNQFHQKHRM